jgi:hypothetical protein
MRLYSCAVCGNPNYVGYDLCKSCWSEFTVTGTMPKPEWMRFLVSNEYSFQTNYAALEYVFSDVEDGEDVHKIEKAITLSQLDI